MGGLVFLLNASNIFSLFAKISVLNFFFSIWLSLRSRACPRGERLKGVVLLG
jgi:hypothetical protein